MTLTERYRRTEIDVHADQVGRLVLVEPFFLEQSEWIAPPADWAPNIVQGKGYDSEVGEGADAWTGGGPTLVVCPSRLCGPGLRGYL